MLTSQKVASPRIDPSFEPHAKLEDIAVNYIQACGYSIHAQTYHETLPQTIQDLLIKSHSISALYVRGRADRLAIGRNRIFEFEIKTHSSKQYSDLSLEVLPLLIHLQKRRFIDCLYVCRVNSQEFGFWVSRLPKIRTIFIPPVRKNEFVASLVEEFAVRNEVTDLNRRSANGSCDPFVIIDKSVVASLCDWRNLVPVDA
ncbi:MAG: hypothetical protein V1899_03140 [Planctomycetota bacterium]